MKANEFARVFGLDIAKIAINECPPEYGLDIIELKRLVESHELVEKLGGIDAAYDEAGSYYTNESRMIEISQAIADVESCQ